MSSDSQAYLAGFRAGSTLAGYRLETQVGAGGMAVVFRARDERLNRLVALKILAPALTSDAEFRARFIAESRAAAAVDDPHIIPVYDAGEAAGVLFIAMRFVRGGDLHRVLAREGALEPERAAGFISAVASALDAAHRAGLVHRDVKPANILVDAREDRPDHVYLSDFGVSKAMASAGLTSPGHFVGTAGYSAPEQIQGRAVDGRTDQYALACVAYQLLTGTLPFGPDQDTPVLLAHLSAPPPLLTARRPTLPGAVDRVVAKGMAKVPEKRYASCLEFADALRVTLGLTPYDRPGSATATAVPQPATAPAESLTSTAAGTADQRRRPEGAVRESTARPASHPRRGDRPAAVAAWTGRHRLLALTVACAILAAAAAIPFVLPSSPKSLSQANAPGPAKSANPANSPAPANQPVYRRVPVNLRSPYAGEAVASLAFGNSGGTLAIADLGVCLWDIAAHTGCTTNPVFQTEDSVAFSPDGKTVAAGGSTGRTYLWEVGTKRLTSVTDPGSEGVNSVAFSPDGKTVAAGDYNGSTYLWDIATAKLVLTITDPGSKGVKPVAFSPDGTILATGDFNGRTYLWNAGTGQLTATLIDPDGKHVNSVAFSPNGNTVAAGDYNGNTYLWDVASRRLARTITDPSSEGVNSVAFSPDGKTLAAGDENGSSYLWGAATGKLAATLIDPGSVSVDAVAFSPGGDTLATGDQSGGLNLWHIS